MKLIFSLVILILSSQSFAKSLALETSSFEEIQKKVYELGKKYGPKNVLVVLDIDNTVLKMNQDLGSDQWFTWQQDNCLGKEKHNFCVADNMSGLLLAQEKLFTLSNMSPTEINAPRIVNEIQGKKYPLFLLTSRSSQYRNSTERELKRNGYKLMNPIGPKNGFAGNYIPYDLKNIKKSGITKDELIVTKIKSARSVSYMNGIMMTSGLHKGIMLKTILNKTKFVPKAIIFADDHIKHTKRMHEVFGNKKGIELVTYRYGKIDTDVAKFKKSDKKEVIEAYASLDKVLSQILK